MKNFTILMIIFCLPLGLRADLKTDNEIKALNKKITELEAKLEKQQLVELKEEVEGQGLMIADWPAYAKEVQMIREIELRNMALQKQIDELEQRKETLLKQNTSPN